jgi:hypothetical protein
MKKINQIETNRKNRNFGDLYRDINEFKKGYHPTTNLVKDENGDLLADGRITSVSYKALMILGTLKCEQLSHRNLNLLLRLKLLLKIWKHTNRQVLVKFR